MRANGQDSWRPAPVPETNSLAKVVAAAKECTACPLYKRATQTVFGEGPKHAKMLMIGEQPGDYEDVAGKPFVGPAGKILDRALEEAGINRDEVYVTNAVKHFKWEPRGKRRIHQKPSSRHRRLPAMAGNRATPGRAQACCLSRFNRGADNLRTELPCHERTWQSFIVTFCTESRGHRSSFLALASAR